MTNAFDPFSVAEPETMFEQLRQMRTVAPVVPIGEGMYYVTRYEPALEILRDTEHFSNAQGFRAPGVEVPPEDRILGEQDPPQHTQSRRIMLSAFSPGVIRREADFTRERARALLSQLPHSGQADLVTAFAMPLPNDVTVHLLGFPMADADWIGMWSRRVMESEWPAMNRTADGEGLAGAFPEYTAYVDAHIESVRRALEGGAPQNSLTGRLLQASIDGDELTAREIRALVFNALLGGLTTTMQLIATMLYELLSAPDRAATLQVAAPEGLAAFVEECLRLYPPVMIIPRGCTAEMTVAGTRFAPGDRVIVGTACVNRDEQVFQCAEEFAEDRPNVTRHLTFGHGPHLCAGAAMARSVAVIALQEFLAFLRERTPVLAPGFSYERVPTYFEYGPRTLPVLLDR